MKLLVDTNVIISGLFGSRSYPGQVMRHWRERHSQWVTCEQQLEELTRVMGTPYVMDKVEGTFGSAYAFMMEFHAHTDCLVIEPPFAPLCRDPFDDYLLAMMDRYPIDFLISGDKDLLSLKGSHPKILSPRELIDRL